MKKLFKKQKNHTNNLIREDIKKAMGRNIDSNSTPTEIWKAINDILKPERMACNHWKIKVNDRYIEEPDILANEFNKFFKTKVETLAEGIKKDSKIDPLEKLKEKVKGRNLKFQLKTVTEMEVSDILRNLKKKTSHGLDGISSEILKLSGGVLIPALRYIINTSILSGKFPTAWKKACVAPLHKKADKFSLKNYRPVALLSVPGMCLEKAVAIQITAFFEEHGLFGNWMFAFRENRSTTNELLTLFDSLLEAKNNRKEIALLMYDLSAAFDTVQPEILIEKLRIYGFNKLALSWIESYLTGRRQVVRIGQSISSEVELTLGTPQGSRLSPLLFSIIFADLDLWIDRSTLSNFADDTQSCIIADTQEELEEIVKEESRAVLNFFNGINLVNNPDKAALLYNAKGKASQITIDGIGGETVESKEREKLLGLQINSGLDWKTHIHNLCSTLKQRLGMLRRIKQRMPKEKLRLVADAIFNSRIRYGIAVFYKPRLTQEEETCTIQEPLQVLQNDMIRELFGHRRKDRINVQKLRDELKMLSVNQLACYHVLLETFNILKKNSSPQIEAKIRPKENINYQMRSFKKGDLKIIDKPKKTCLGFTYVSAKLWNMLPEDIRKSDKPGQFKAKIKSWITAVIPPS